MPDADAAKLTKNQRKKLKQKKRKQAAHSAAATAPAAAPAAASAAAASAAEPQVEYIADPDLVNDPQFAAFKEVFARLQPPEALTSDEQQDTEMAEAGAGAGAGAGGEDEDEEDEEDEANRVSNRKRKQISRLTVAQLKQLVERPDAVAREDVTAADPQLLVHLKSYRNAVPVPRHWSQKRKYLMNKRGIDKIPYRLPEFIAETGIQKLRDAYLEKEAEKALKQKSRERVQPKMGNMDIDYHILYNAFFKSQTKPRLTQQGDLYHENKEFEVDHKRFRPGVLSDRLKTALGMDPADTKSPPPYLVAMQRFGPPPSYPNMEIPGLNAPIPAGAQFGYNPGQWGRPPVDEFGRPLYGDVFAAGAKEEQAYPYELPAVTEPWGPVEDLDEEEDDEGDEGDEDGAADGDGAAEAPVPAGVAAHGLATPDGIRSVSSTAAAHGMQTPASIDLRKTQKRQEAEELEAARGGEERKLFTVLPEREAAVGSGQVFGSAHTYEMPGTAAPPPPPPMQQQGEKRKLDEQQQQQQPPPPPPPANDADAFDPGKRDKKKKKRDDVDDFKF